jgi:hypothetical protein
MAITRPTWTTEYQWRELWSECAALDLLCGRDPDAAVPAGTAAERRHEGRLRAKENVDAAIKAGALDVLWEPLDPKVQAAIESADAALANDVRTTVALNRLYGRRYSVRPAVLTQWVAKTPGRFPDFPFTPEDFAANDGTPLHANLIAEHTAAAATPPPDAPSRFVTDPRERRARERTAFAKNLRRLCTSRGWSLDDLAHKTNQDKSNVSRHLNGKAFPNPSTRKVYAGVLDVTIDDLLAE